MYIVIVIEKLSQLQPWAAATSAERTKTLYGLQWCKSMWTVFSDNQDVMDKRLCAMNMSISSKRRSSLPLSLSMLFYCRSFDSFSLTLCTFKHRKRICTYLSSYLTRLHDKLDYVRLSRNLHVHYVRLSRNLYVHYVS